MSDLGLIRVGAAVKLDAEQVARLCTPDSVHMVDHMLGASGIVRGFPYRPSGWPQMVRVDFGDAGEWRGPVTMLRPAYDDA